MKSVLYSAYYVLGGTGGWLYTVNESQTNRRESTSIHNKPWDKKWLMYGAGDEGSGFDMIAYIWDWQSPSSRLWGGAPASCLAKLGSRKNRPQSSHSVCVWAPYPRGGSCRAWFHTLHFLPLWRGYSILRNTGRNSFCIKSPLWSKCTALMDFKR